MLKTKVQTISIVLFVMMMFAMNSQAATVVPKVDKIDPPCWFTQMKDPSLQLMVYGKDIASSDVHLNYPGVSIQSIVKLESPNYLLVYLTITDEAKPGTLQLVFTNGAQQLVQPYVLKARKRDALDRKGFSMSDVLYLLMPDRFADGDESNDQITGLAPYKVDRQDPNARHGGDLKGVMNHLDYFTDLGITALWFTPVMENDMNGGSYHGYATTDYYKVDPRLGTNQEYKTLIEQAHKKGLKVVMDMIFNHCGIGHPWIKDMPSKNWFNHADYTKEFEQTSFILTPHVDPYTSKYDFEKMNDGWFVREMPDLNQRNPYVLTYLIQNSFWWIEEADIDGIRMDTHPYADYDAMATWLRDLNAAYPNFNVVGETWVTEPAYTAWYQKDSKLSAPRNSNLKTVMDFSFYDKLSQAKSEETTGMHSGLNRIYNSFVYDFLYPDTDNILAFIENHDTPRYLYDGSDLTMLKQGITLLLTTHRIPQLYYGTEMMMNGTKTKSDGEVRKDFLGGWSDDTRSWFNPADRTPLETSCFNFFRTLLHWRQGNEVIAKGKMIQWIPENGIYVYARLYQGKTVLVLLNGTSEQRVLPIKVYKQVIKDHTSATDVSTGRVYDLTKDIVMNKRESLILQF